MVKYFLFYFMDKNLSYKEEQYKKRIANLKKLAKERITEEIINIEKRTPTKTEVNKIYNERIKEYDKVLIKKNKGIATGGPAAAF